MTLNEWILNGRVGISSKTIWSVIQGVEYEGDRPYDPSDFGRCYDFIKQCNITNQQLKKVSKKLPYWKPYIDNWAKLTEMYEKNCMKNWENCEEIGMYKFMKELQEQSEKIQRTQN